MTIKTTHRPSTTPRHYKEFLHDLCMRGIPAQLVTITLARTYTDTEALRTFSFFCKLVQAKLRLGNEVRGIGFVERTWKNVRFESQLHLHCVLWDDCSWSETPDDRLRSVVHDASMKLKDSHGRQMSCPENTDVQRIDDARAVVDYVTKDIDHWLPERRSIAFEVTAKGLRLEAQLNGAAQQFT